MLLNFFVENYKTYDKKTVFDMQAGKSKGLDYSILKERKGRRVFKGLCSSVVYGPNASGKTNLLGAMDTFKCIVLRGNILNEKASSLNAAALKLELIPNVNLKTKKPVKFGVKFIESGYVIEYLLELDLGFAFDTEYDRSITKEVLHIDEKLVFERDEKLTIGNLKFLEEEIIDQYKEDPELLKRLADSNLSSTELFLNNGFKNLISSKLAKIILDWFDDKFMVLYSSNKVKAVINLDDSINDDQVVIDQINGYIHQFGKVNNDIGYKKSKNNSGSELLSIIEMPTDGSLRFVPSSVYESLGTIRFIEIFPIILSALKNGNVLVIDEFDSSIHPMAVMDIINIFHNDDININKAQLIFNTHNPIFLSPYLFRKDEIKFVDSDENGFSSLYKLEDIKDKNGRSSRMDENIVENYFNFKYGAIKNIEFSEFVKQYLKEGTSDE